AARAGGTPPPEAAAGAEGADGAPKEEAEAAPGGPGDDPIFKDVEAQARAAGWTTIVHRSLPDMTLQARLNTAPWDSMQDLFRANAIAVALASLGSVYNMIFAQTQNEIRTTKAVTQQKLAKYGSPKDAKGPSPTADLLADLKSRVQRLSTEFQGRGHHGTQD